ncbi:hypothetical protein CTAYLR_004621 [Chrysophaeum taylorii]|uniref:Carbonyl reductase n=1 Tax=Chrysophaeum taylorii TaxID=2483200 RepID=A0AAD7XRZ0_9STRA|nr:hypothetical protein CTAYLR_004621 [Chrysophaeum taylorii]
MCRVAVVTGANKGIGFYVAQQLLPTVSVVVLACRDVSKGEAAARELGSDKIRVEELDISDSESIRKFAKRQTRVDVLVNNAAMAFKAADPTPFVAQAGPTLKTNFFGTVELTEALKPVLTEDARIVNVASLTGRLAQVSPERQEQFKNVPDLGSLEDLVREFQADVEAGCHLSKGWGNSNYGFSKLAVIAYTKLLARTGFKANCCCPGFCRTDMSSHQGTRTAEEGARNAVMLALPDCDLNGAYIRDEAVAEW